MTGNGALAGIKVANFSWVTAGPLTIRYLAHHGAMVVRVESHARPDMVRIMVPFLGRRGDPNYEPWFANINSGQYGLSIDINKPKGLEIAWRLIKWADVVAESFGVGKTKKWGIDYQSVKAVRPDIVYISTTTMGQTGPSKGFIGYGYQAMARAGFTGLCGWPDRDPAPPQMAYTDFVAPRFNVAAIMAALDHRRRTGEGQYIDSSQSECSLHLLGPVLMDCSVNGRVMNRNGNRVDNAAPHGVYPCQGDDRWCAIAVFTDEEWRMLCLAAEHFDWANDPRFATLAGRKEHEDELDRVIGEWTSGMSAEDLESKLQAAGIAAAVASNSQDVFEDPQVKHRGYFAILEHPFMGPHPYRGVGFKLSRTPAVPRPGSGLGEHNEMVCRDLLGMTDDEIAEALIDGGITTEEDLPGAPGTLTSW